MATAGSTRLFCRANNAAAKQCTSTHNFKESCLQLRYSPLARDLPSRYVSTNVQCVASPSAEQVSQAKSFDDIPEPVKSSNGPIGIIRGVYDAWKKDTFKRPHLATMRNFKELGPIYKVKLGNGEFIVQCMDTKDIEFIYHNDGKYPQRMHIEAWKDYRKEKGKPLGVLIDDGEPWMRQRNALSKRILRPPEIAQFAGIMNEVAQEFAEKMKRIRLDKDRGDDADVVEDLEIELNKWAMESSCKFFFDRKLYLIANELKDENKDFFDAIVDLTENSIFLMAVPLKFHKKFNSKPLRKTNAAWDTIFSLSKKYVNEKTNEIEERKRLGEEADDGSYLAYLIEKGTLTKEEIYGNMTELLAASVDTTAGTSTWMLYLLSRNPQVQEKLRKEVMSIIPEDIHPTREQIDRMPYLKAVVKETLRLYPVTAGTARELPIDAIVHGYHIPARTPLLTHFYSSGRSPDNYKNPDQFQPERWLDQSIKNNPFASQPFGFGTRMCLGRRLAEQELYLLGCQIVRNFVLESAHDVGSKMRLLMVPEEPLRIKFHDRI